MNRKHLLESKTFWFNLLTFAVTVVGLLPPKYALPLSSVINIGLRLISNQPVNLFPSKDSE